VLLRENATVMPGQWNHAQHIVVRLGNLCCRLRLSITWVKHGLHLKPNLSGSQPSSMTAEGASPSPKSIPRFHGVGFAAFPPEKEPSLPLCRRSDLLETFVLPRSLSFCAPRARRNDAGRCRARVLVTFVHSDLCTQRHRVQRTFHLGTRYLEGV
jgi:hypothetical protein